MKKLLSTLLISSLIITSLGLSVFATDDEIPEETVNEFTEDELVENDETEEVITDEEVKGPLEAPAYTPELVAPTNVIVSVAGVPSDYYFSTTWDHVEREDVQYAFRIWAGKGPFKPNGIYTEYGITENVFDLPHELVFPNKTYSVQVGSYIPSTSYYNYATDRNNKVLWAEPVVMENQVPISVKPPKNVRGGLVDSKDYWVELSWSKPPSPKGTKK